MKQPSLLTNRSFLATWSGNVISELGGAFGTFCHSILVFQLTGSTFALGSMWLLYFLPSLVLQLFIGPFIDRWSRKWMMVISQWLRACVFVVPLLALTVGNIDIWHIYVVQIIIGLISPLYVPANQAILPTIVKSNQLKQANAYVDSTVRIMMFLAPIAAGVTIEGIGVQITLAIVCILLVVSGCALLFIDEPRLDDTEIRKAWLEDFREGFTFFFKQKIIVWLGVFLAFVQFGVGVTMVTTLPYITGELSGTYAQYGFFMAGFPIGYALGAIITPKIKSVSRRRTMLGALFVGGMTFTVLAFNQSISFAIVTEAIGGFAMAIFSIHNLTLCQQRIPNRLMGKVFSIRLLLIRVSMPFGVLVGGGFGDLVGIRPLYLFIGLLISIVAFLGMLLPFFSFINDDE
ncbi:MFS transporter [Alkalihalobacillus sp. LMS6]|uniref:MFS transporter n=1 Tax=Alkalihalobacillus sp. LMS6 TaxID=2924034 RepID=UPI0020D166DF|nr:MFS transporter [Alkalihalobacillus sp. LMS6]UTR06679.1 MFS transporter [Alkalihalobacillus sp. LMS6]